MGIVLLGTALSCAVMALGYLLRELRVIADPVFWSSGEIVSVFLGVTIAANTVVRFSGSVDRVALLLGLGFGATGLFHLGEILELYRHLSAQAGAPPRIPLSWMAGQTLLAFLMLLATVLDKRLPWPQDARRAAFAVGSVVLAAGGLILLAFLAVPQGAIRPDRWVPRPWDLMAAGMFLAATAVLSQKRRQLSACDAALSRVAGLNAASHLIASQSDRLLDAPAMAAQAVQIGAGVLLLGAALLDNARMFGQVRRHAMRDGLTGLANYRHLTEVLQGELERSGRTGRPFAVLLMDLDNLKQINDGYGHVTGSRAICRVADALRQHCRSIDTAARYGGDEFALVLPETDESAACRVAERIENRLAADPETPPLSVSIGIAVHPCHGTTVQRLLHEADRELYAVKARKRSRKKRTPQP